MKHKHLTRTLFTPHQRFFLLAIFLSVHILKAQNYYGGEQYGGQATFMGGTAVVGTSDNSNIYYNPSAAVYDSSKLTATTYIYGVEVVHLKNGFGKDLPLNSQRVNVFPELITATIPLKKIPRLKLVIGTFTRYRTNISITKDYETNYDVIPSSPGTEYYKADANYTNNSFEQWAGIGIAYRISPVWSVGLSYFGTVTYMEVNARQNITVDALANGTPYTATVHEYNSMSMDQVSQIFKLGVTARFKKVYLGMALTLPGINTWGTGKLDKSFETYNLDKNATDTTHPAYRHPSYVISDVQSGLHTYYRQPFAISVGVELLYTKFRVAAALDFHAGYADHVILQGQDRATIRPEGIYGFNSVAGFMNLQTSASPVLNAGIGAEVHIKPTMNVLFGMRTDFNNGAEYLPNNSIIGVRAMRSPVWHYLYLSAGLSYKLHQHQATVGIDYGVGIPKSREQLFNVSDPQQNLFLQGAIDHSMGVFVNRVNIVLSWTYFFKQPVSKYGPIPLFDMPPKKKQKHKKVNG